MPAMPAVIESAAPVAPSISIPTLRCYVYPIHSGLYEAECIDLDLVVRAKSSNKAKESLNTAIGGYLKTALRGDVRGLVPRPSPLSRRLRYQLYRRLVQLRHRIHHSTKGFKLFTVDPHNGAVHCAC